MDNAGVTVVLSRPGQVLLTRREDLPIWCLPGGKIEAHESPIEAARREALEETGLSVEIREFIGLYSRPLWGPSGALEIVFAAQPSGGELKLTNETTDIRYWPVAALPLALPPWSRQIVADAAAGCRGLYREFPTTCRQLFEELLPLVRSEITAHHRQKMTRWLSPAEIAKLFENASAGEV